MVTLDKATVSLLSWGEQGTSHPLHVISVVAVGFVLTHHDAPFFITHFGCLEREVGFGIHFIL